MDIKLKFMILFFSITFVVIISRLVIINSDDRILKISQNYGKYIISSAGSYPPILDRNFNKLTNEEFDYYAVVSAKDKNLPNIVKIIDNNDLYYSNIQKNYPFLCKITSNSADLDDPNLLYFKSYVRNDENQLANHIIGYRSSGEGICGLEKTYDDFFTSKYTENTAIFDVDAVGNVLDGIKVEKSYAKEQNSAVVVTLDKNIQEICENALYNSSFEKGAAIVMNVKTGDILASVSKPDINLTNLEESINDENLPFVNRVFSEYSVGSIFKLVTATAALESGISPEFSYFCDGSIDVNGQHFNCHKWGGHAEIDMFEAMEFSCNPYFIAISEFIDNEKYLEIAGKYGFGTEQVFTKDLISSSGNLPTINDLKIPAEKANFSFGQGKLTATPLQICSMTATIANGGVYNTPKLIVGEIENNVFTRENKVSCSRVISPKTAEYLSAFMVDVVNSSNSMSKSNYFQSAGKTSTAQTGNFDSYGNEIYNCFYTGFFPSNEPKYSITILIEGGKSGNLVAGPIYKQISEQIFFYNKNKKDGEPS